jgi:hypothetical protein
MARAARHSGSSASRRAAASAPTKFGMRPRAGKARDALRGEERPDVLANVVFHRLSVA